VQQTFTVPQQQNFATHTQQSFPPTPLHHGHIQHQPIQANGTVAPNSQKPAYASSFNSMATAGAALAGKSYKKTAKFLSSSKGKKYAMGAGGLLVAGLIGADIGDGFGDGGDLSGGGETFSSGDTAGDYSSGGGGDYAGGGGGYESAASADMAYQNALAQNQMMNDLTAQTNAMSIQGAQSISMAAGNTYV
jgi:hypothetical protein